MNVGHVAGDGHVLQFGSIESLLTNNLHTIADSQGSQYATSFERLCVDAGNVVADDEGCHILIGTTVIAVDRVVGCDHPRTREDYSGQVVTLIKSVITSITNETIGYTAGGDGQRG